MIVILSTYPPREDGIATFAQDLLVSLKKITSGSIRFAVAAINPSSAEKHSYPPEVRWQLNPDSISDYRQLARTLNKDPTITSIIIQHEYGIFGGTWGDNLLAFMKDCQKPMLVTMHTVMATLLDDNMRRIQDDIVNLASAIIVLTERSKKILLEFYPDSQSKINVIPHGIHPFAFITPSEGKKDLKLSKYIVLSTFGFLSRGKGIEYVIQSLPPVVKKYPNLQYLILGETHPNVRRQEGESYRLELIDLVKKLKLIKNVKFYDQYLELDEILAFLKATDVYISTSTNPNQAVSGTLSYALGSGRAVVSTKFSQSQDFVTPDVGILVPPNNVNAYSEALLQILSDENKLLKMDFQAYIKTRNMAWPNVGLNYLKILDTISPPKAVKSSLLSPINLSHLKKITDKFGLIQFTQIDKPNKRFGYTVDDNARALVLMNMLALHQYPNRSLVDRLSGIYLNLVQFCQADNINFVNYVSSKKKFTILNQKEDSESWYARALWGLSFTFYSQVLPQPLISQTLSLWNKSLPSSKKILSPHAQIIMIRSLFYGSRPDLIKPYAESLVKQYKKSSDSNWNWFETCLTYDSGSFVEAMFLAYQATSKKEYLNIAIKSLDFLIGVCFWEEVYVPIGQKNWYFKNKDRSIFDQQPEDTLAMIMALSKAYQVTSLPRYRDLAIKAYSWFLGNNILGVPLYNSKNGGCFDGLNPQGVNQNQGAESQLSYLLSRLIISDLL